MPSLAIKIPSIRRANKNDLSIFFEVSLPTIDAWLKKDCPAVQRGARGTPWLFDLREVAEWVYSRGAPETEDGEIDPDRMEPIDRKAWYEGTRLKRNLAKEAEELLTAEQYVENQSALLQPVAACLETLPDVLERKCALKPKVVMAIRDALDEYRNEVANKVIENVRSGSD